MINYPKLNGQNLHLHLHFFSSYLYAHTYNYRNNFNVYIFVLMLTYKQLPYAKSLGFHLKLMHNKHNCKLSQEFLFLIRDAIRVCIMSLEAFCNFFLLSKVRIAAFAISLCFNTP